MISVYPKEERMTKEELARILDGCEYGEEMTDARREIALQSRLVVVYGASDDLTEFDGAIRDEAGLGESFVMGGPLPRLMEPHDCNCLHCGFLDKNPSAVRVNSDYTDKGFSVRCSIPAATFSVMEGGERYGDGLVFQI